MTFFTDYTKRFSEHVTDIDDSAMARCVEMILATSASGGKVLVAGNGGSAGIASHLSLDLAHGAGVRAVCFSDPGLLTCLANDHGYEEWVERALRMQADPGDLAVIISSSGQSENMLRGAKYANENQLKTITVTGFDADNPLRKLGQENLWVDSSAYNVVEGVHHVWLLALVDAINAQRSN